MHYLNREQKQNRIEYVLLELFQQETVSCDVDFRRIRPPS